MILLSRHQDIGAILRRLRHTSGLTVRTLAKRAYISPSAVQKREARSGLTAAGLIEHAAVLGYRVALIPDRRDRRYTGTGWPA